MVPKGILVKALYLCGQPSLEALKRSAMISFMGFFFGTPMAFQNRTRKVVGLVSVSVSKSSRAMRALASRRAIVTRDLSSRYCSWETKT